MENLRDQISQTVLALDEEEQKMKREHRKTKQMETEMAALKEHMRSCTYTRNEMEKYKKSVEEQVKNRSCILYTTCKK